MTARHGCGPRATNHQNSRNGHAGRAAAGGLRALVWASTVVVALGSGTGGGTAVACHIKSQGAAKDATGTTPSTTAAQILNPTSLVNMPPTLTATSAALPAPTAPPPTPTTAPQVTAVAAPPSALMPSPLSNPPAAEGILPAAPAVASYSSGAAPTCSCLCPPINPPPFSTNPNPPADLNPGTPATPNIAPNAPEPSTIVSALAMIACAVVARRRRGRVA